MPSRYETFGRMNQKRRTRAALIAAAAGIVRRGETPTVEQAAREAFISRSTAYRYFPSQEALVAEAMLDAVIGAELQGVYAAARSADTAWERLDAVVRADHALVTGHEAAFRALLRATLAVVDDDGTTPRRPGNRLRYLSEALEPLRDRIGDEGTQRLVTALSMCVGVESAVVLTDICGLSSADAETLKRWIAGALLHASVSESVADAGAASGH